MPIDRLFEKYASGRMLHIGEYDVFTNEFAYTNDYAIIDTKVRSCTYHFGNFFGSMVQFNVHPHCEVFVSIDGGETREFLTATQIHKLQLDGKAVQFFNMESLHDIKNNGKRIRYYTEQYKENYTYRSGILYGVINNTGCLLSKYRGKYTLLGSFIGGE